MPSIPLDISIAGPVVGGNSFNVTINLSAAAPVGGMNIEVTSAGPVLPPTGSTFPLTVPIAAGNSSVTMTLGSSTVTTNTDVQIKAGDAGANLSVCANWRASCTARITP